MKPFIFCGILIFCGAPVGAAPRANTSPQRPQALHFARGATSLAVRGFLGHSQNRFYTLKTRAGQKLRIRADSAPRTSGYGIVPLLAVTPPRGKFNGDKTAIYATNSSRSGIYKIRISTNLMASNGPSGDFVLRVSAR
ncbi:hypothetical protein B1R32_10579 [Abditibacterium utsteinense]|uniref:Uncharacterized protein n=1 Tax=Abditibacterium utsteinense TaxID=1960156 RepID=A0A2S8SUE1_9BACT|nr:hypothetical protein [Abditibacterium utsteinense]PQV64398.1 hypothetical protein B1R32_10579 [Abditibacterium utsteinense]